MRISEFDLREPVPDLNRPIAVAMLRPWIDVGRVGTLALNTLQRHLGAQELGRLAEPGKFFDFTRYRPRMRTVNKRRVFTTPNTIIHHAHDDATKQGLPVSPHQGAARLWRGVLPRDLRRAQSLRRSGILSRRRDVRFGPAYKAASGHRHDDRRAVGKGARAGVPAQEHIPGAHQHRQHGRRVW